jgi:hypothetical protein
MSCFLILSYLNASCRSRRALEHRKNMDEDRLLVLEQMLKETSEAAVESEKKYDEVNKITFYGRVKLEMYTFDCFIKFVY